MTEYVLAQAASGEKAPFDPTMLIMLAAFGLLIFMMMRGRKKAAKAQEEIRSNLAVGAEVMTQFGLFGTIASIDTDENKIVLEVSPGSFVTVHSQVVAKVVASEEAGASVEVPNDASSLTSASVESADEAPGAENETPEETLRRLNNDDKGPKA
ncbi:preprotein translocase subunit YajC [Paeniglutamicibacter psychrophenolicus]|uniref:preprotein translocase subunit YajC n=1 Tax=Paeniglutamicibacter psychrophenolicus TaxID=257454 RepID=UPI00278A99D9|nr:preprotein translocase subunit YajC [Paeniglutamicibacter psychrophenolicus]MDQ0093902.1 preprotein translocase subunit YajC [Paeniglutamicibacter psychrophenolicus]